MGRPDDGLVSSLDRQLVDELYPNAQTEYAAFKAAYHGGNLAAATGGLPVEAGGAFEKKDDLEDELARELAELNAPLTATKDKGIRNVNLIGTDSSGCGRGGRAVMLTFCAARACAWPHRHASNGDRMQ
jgi:hypothetical protein